MNNTDAQTAGQPGWVIRATACGAFIVALCAFSNGVSAQALPSPYSLTSQLDLECHRAESDEPPPVQDLFIRQLNPELQDTLPNQSVELGRLENVCVPVMKNQQVPSPDAYPFARWFDLACYEAKAELVDVEVKLNHLNPVLAKLPREKVRLTELDQVCLPVRKNDSDIPDAVRRIVSHFDFACYDLDERTEDVKFPLVLSHINPVIREMDLRDRRGLLRSANQLCVPIAKNNQQPPEEALRLVRWADFLKYDFRPRSFLEVPPFVAPIPLVLSHLNPLFAWAPRFETVLQAPLKLMVPVAKNGRTPPGD